MLLSLITQDHDEEILEGQMLDPGTNSDLLSDLEELGQGSCSLCSNSIVGNF
jgi:hypothetical protein